MNTVRKLLYPKYTEKNPNRQIICNLFQAITGFYWPGCDQEVLTFHAYARSSAFTNREKNGCPVNYSQNLIRRFTYMTLSGQSMIILLNFLSVGRPTNASDSFL